MGRPPGRPPKVARELVEIAEPEEDFSDVSGNPNAEFALENQDPGRKYCWVHNSRESRLEIQAQTVGWRPVKYTGDALHDPESGMYAVRPVGADGMYQVGEEVVKRDHVLYDCDRSRWEKRRRYLEGEHLKILGRYKAKHATRGELAAAFQE
jgi:hypothetical protein